MYKSLPVFVRPAICPPFLGDDVAGDVNIRVGALFTSLRGGGGGGAGGDHMATTQRVKMSESRRGVQVTSYIM
ncbi:hypothetical protein FKM82_026223 [Ascaphus truei]